VTVRADTRARGDPVSAAESLRASGPQRRVRAWAVDVAILWALKLVIDALVLARGFSHVSDDDYSRTVIAEQFAHAPRLDPSGTSWLPLPFWLEGTTMMLIGRSLGAARAVAIVLGAATVAAPYAAMRAVGVQRAVTLAAVAIAMALPWNAWLGVATVPEAWTGALVAAAAIGMANERARPWSAAALLVASLCRYEAWPACAGLAILSVLRAARAGHGKEDRAREIACALVAAAGPIAWMAWNAYVHGSPVHFLARVSAFRQAIGAANLPVPEKLLGYPRALVEEVPEAAVLGACGVAGLFASAALRRRWGPAAWSAAAILAFLIVGDVRDGAPTHHPARALAPVAWVLVGMGVDAIALWRERRATRVASIAMGIAWCASLPGRFSSAPGRGDLERRDAQIARGLDLRARAVPAAVVTPCSFEHFALIAAWGEPERARIRERTRQPPTMDCPRVTELEPDLVP
jgi:hypothetical protein